jgi:NADPH:quinone reductase-like Zn-dependent oxidoreductase
VRAIVRDEYGSPDVLRLEEIEKPVAGEGEVVVAVRAASLNTADLDGLKGVPRVVRLGTGLRRPRNRRLGLDVAGTVETVGEGVTSFKAGDEVWADLSGAGLSRFGAFAEYVSGPEKAFHTKPKGIGFEEAAAVPHSGVLALQGLTGKGPIRPGERVLVNGAGGCVGPFGVQIAKAYGAEVTGVDHTDKLDLLRRLGADHVIDYTHEDFAGNGQKYDLILDIADRYSVLHYRRSLTKGGRYILIARTLGGFAQAALLGGLLTLAGSKRMGVFTWRPNNRRDLEVLGGLIVTGKIEPLIERRIELSEVPAALRYLEQGRARGKLVVAM